MITDVTIDPVKLLNLLGGESQIGTGVVLTEFIAASEIIVNEDLGGIGLSDARRNQIALFLAAHFAILAIERGGLVRYKVGESTEAYKSGSDSDRGFNLTRFGQQAISLDNTGTLALNASPMHKAEFEVL